MGQVSGVCSLDCCAPGHPHMCGVQAPGCAAEAGKAHTTTRASDSREAHSSMFDSASIDLEEENMHVQGFGRCRL